MAGSPSLRKQEVDRSVVTVTSGTVDIKSHIHHHKLDLLNQIPRLNGMSPWLLMVFRYPKRPLAGIQDGYNRKGLISEHGQKKRRSMRCKRQKERKLWACRREDSASPIMTATESEPPNTSAAWMMRSFHSSILFLEWVTLGQRWLANLSSFFGVSFWGQRGLTIVSYSASAVKVKHFR